MPRKGEVLSAAHKAKMMAGRIAKKGSSATAPGKPEDGERLANGRNVKGSFEATKPLISEGQVPNLSKKRLNALVQEEKPVVRRKRGVQSSGEPAAVEDASYIVDRNTGPSAVITYQLPGQKQAIKDSLAVKVPKLPGQTEDPDPPNKTVENIPSEDVKSLKVKPAAPFSMAALRQRLLC